MDSLSSQDSDERINIQNLVVDAMKIYSVLVKS
jgi:hypothetical protein